MDQHVRATDIPVLEVMVHYQHAVRSITDECTWEAEKVVDILKDYNFYELTSSSQTPGLESDSTQHVNVGMWCLISGSEREMWRTGKEDASF